MKAKSSPTGPTAGFIAENPIYSKVSISSYSKQSNYLAAAVQKGAKAIDLTISQSRINELINTGNLISHGGGRSSAAMPVSFLSEGSRVNYSNENGELTMEILACYFHLDDF